MSGKDSVSWKPEIYLGGPLTGEDAELAEEMGNAPYAYSTARFPGTGIEVVWDEGNPEEAKKRKEYVRLISAAPEMLEALKAIQKRAYPKPDRTLGDCADELIVIDDLCRYVLASAQPDKEQDNG